MIFFRSFHLTSSLTLSNSAIHFVIEVLSSPERLVNVPSMSRIVNKLAFRTTLFSLLHALCSRCVLCSRRVLCSWRHCSATYLFAFALVLCRVMSLLCVTNFLTFHMSFARFVTRHIFLVHRLFFTCVRFNVFNYLFSCFCLFHFVVTFRVVCI